ncbi:hypothetical protein SM033_00109 [Vibrio phage vB_VpaM_sm033]|nr:hypothetical protein SM033_00109 [Vibrio phage vB_VpaM_sm033]
METINISDVEIRNTACTVRIQTEIDAIRSEELENLVDDADKYDSNINEIDFSDFVL